VSESTGIAIIEHGGIRDVHAFKLYPESVTCFVDSRPCEFTDDFFKL